MDATNTDLIWASRQFMDGRQLEYNIYHEYVSGKQPIRFATGRFKDAFGTQFDKFAYNRTDSIVDAIADRLKVIGFDAAGQYQPAADLAQQIWDQNFLDSHEDDIEAECLTSGDAYVVVEQDVQDPTKVNIWPQYAQNIRVRYSTGRPGEIEVAARQWLDGYGSDRRIRLNLYYRDRIEKYQSVNKGEGVALASDTRWEPVPTEVSGDRKWPVELKVKDTVPVFHFANNARINGYGVSELKAVIPIQDALNKAVMDLLVGMEFSAFRQRVVLNVDLDDPKAEERIEQLEVGMNRLISLVSTDPDMQAGIAEFSATDVRQFVGPIDQFDTMISRVSKIPVHYLQMGSAPESGEARRMAEAPFVAKIERLQSRFGDVISRMMTYAVRLAGQMSVPAGALETRWKSAMPLSDRETLDFALARQSLGFPLRSNLREMGRDKDDIEEIMLEVTEENARRVAMFNAGNIDAMPGFRLPVTSN